MPKRRGLRLLQVGLVWHEYIAVSSSDVGGLLRETPSLAHEVRRLFTKQNSQRNASGLTPRPPSVEPSRGVPQALGEESLA